MLRKNWWIENQIRIKKGIPPPYYQIGINQQRFTPWRTPHLHTYVCTCAISVTTCTWRYLQSARIGTRQIHKSLMYIHIMYSCLCINTAHRYTQKKRQVLVNKMQSLYLNRILITQIMFFPWLIEIQDLKQELYNKIKRFLQDAVIFFFRVYPYPLRYGRLGKNIPTLNFSDLFK